MTGNSDRSTIAVIREMTKVLRQLILLETLEKLLEVSKDGDEVKFLPLLKSMANYASKETANDTSELNPVLLSLIALLEQKERKLSSQSDRHDRQ